MKLSIIEWKKKKKGQGCGGLYDVKTFDLFLRFSYQGSKEIVIKALNYLLINKIINN